MLISTLRYSDEPLRMAKEAEKALSLRFHPLTPDRWRDLEKVFGERGACGGCWCMWWRLKRSEWERQKGKLNRQAFKRIVDSGEIAGILAYAGSEPIGWCSVAPREAFPALERSRTLKRVDDVPVWSIVCFFVLKHFRRKGVSCMLVKAAVDYAAEHGGRVVEGYPTEPQKGGIADPFAWTGLASTFRKVGFVEVLRRSKSRPIMRYTIREEKEA